MAPLPVVANVIKTEFRIADDASIDAGSRFFLKYSGGPPNSTDLNTLASDVASEWGSNLATYTYQNEHLISVVCTDLSSTTGAQGTWTGSNAGTAGGNQLPAGVCAVVNHEIARRYRGGRPRTYLRIGVDGDMSGTNQWSQAAIGNFLAAWEAWIAAILAVSGLSITLDDDVNISYYEGFTVFTTPSGRARNIPTLRTTPVVDLITSSTVAAKLGSQRRRLNL